MSQDRSNRVDAVAVEPDAPDELVQYRMMIERAADAIFVSDAKGYYRIVNDRACELVGYSREELLGLHLHDLMFPEDVKRNPPRLRELQEGQVLLFERRLRRKDGSAALVELNAKQLPDGSYEGIAREIGDSRKIHSGLLQADRLAAVGVLAASLAHEVNNPLTYSLYNLEGLAEDVGQLEELLSGARKAGVDVAEAADELRRHLENVPDLQERLRAALEGVRRVRDVVHDLETFSNVESDRRVSLELRTVIDSALRLSSTECRHRARVVTDYGDTPPVLGSPARLAQVFLNLILNAAQAIPEGRRADNEIRVVLSSERDEVLAEVYDTGEGILPEHLEHVFDPFFSTRPIGIGSGLGLSVCHNIVHAHGGSIEVESTPGRGSCFRVRLPAVVEETTASQEEPAPSPEPMRSLRVLVVDDEPEVGKAVYRMLSRNHDVTVLRSGAEARQVLAREKFDVIVCDLMMPDLSGMDLYDHLSSEHPELLGRVVFMTGGAFTERARRFVEQVSNVCLAKPFKPLELRRVVDRLGQREALPN